MEILFEILGVIITVIIANFLAQRFKTIPQAMWQIILGVLIAVIPGLAKIEVSLDPEWFMVLIIAPLLFYEGQQTKARIVSKNLKKIVQLAVILAIITMFFLTIILKFAFNWPIALALALSAIATPTDATALESVKEGLVMPTKIEQSLSFEAMFNDASGLVALELAGIWAVTGHLSPGESISKFLFVSLGGALFGIISTFVIVRIRQNLLRSQLNDLTGHIMLQILTPIIIYMLAEEIHVSGVIAVVIAGIFHREEQDRTLLQSSQMINLINQFWKILTDLLNGIVFVILGTSIVQIFAREADVSEWIKLISLAITIYVVMGIVRFSYVYLKDKKIKDAFIFAISGVHGTVTLALALTIPLTMNLSRNSAVVQEILGIAAFVILLSLLTPLIVLRFFLKKKETSYTDEELSKAHAELVNSATNYIEQLEVEKNMKQKLLLSIRSQLGYEDSQRLDRQEWHDVMKQLNLKRDEAVRKAIGENTLSADAVNLWDKMMLKNADINNKAIRRSRIYKEFIKHNWRYFLRKIFKRDNVSREIERTQGKIRKYKRELSKTVTENKKNKIMEKIKIYNKRLLILEKYSDVDYRNRWIGAYNELESFFEPIDKEFIQRFENETDDKTIVVALKQSILAEQNRMEKRLSSEVEETNELSKILQYELTQINLMIQNDKISSELGKRLYYEVAAAQNLLLNS
ncbi:cation:proton antiporter [Liquorilactobacillus mali]|uniref:NhaP-type Na+ H+ and K+ H+ antiporter n=1 Tax=Liquorilactobacillus mali TaxID=1618 RepID=A0A0R2FY22_9LACO|nr:sodium:proton antiporter [Liquorilactobacillus mali]KRN29796.1 NhaP-type Na+ H+ and K+ H+ antiporter [Liquorilactobacillus mali]